MRTPAWSRLRVFFDEKVRTTLFSLTLLGSAIRIENIIPESWSFLVSQNKLFSCITLGYHSASSIELSFLASIIYLIALVILLIALPRDIQITTSREDYVKRSLTALNALNIKNWIKAYIELHNSKGPIASTEIISNLRRYEEYCIARSHAGCEVDFDKNFNVLVTQALQEKYDHYNRRSRRGLRRTTFVLLTASTSLGAIVVVDSIIQTFSVIFTS